VASSWILFFRHNGKLYGPEKGSIAATGWQW